MDRATDGGCGLEGRAVQAGSCLIPLALRRSTVLIVVVLLSTTNVPASRAQTVPLGEYQLKAAFLFNFAKFIEWPAASFANRQSPFTICILGADPFGPTMDDALQGKTIGDRSVAVERSKNAADARRCQIVFVSSSEKHKMQELLEAFRGTNALVVGETDGFAAAGGAVQFTLEDNHVRFLINTDAAERAGLKVSSKLLSLARVVHDSIRGDRS